MHAVLAMLNNAGFSAWDVSLSGSSMRAAALHSSPAVVCRPGQRDGCSSVALGVGSAAELREQSVRHCTCESSLAVLFFTGYCRFRFRQQIAIGLVLFFL